MDKPLSGLRILVVEDEMLIRLTIEDVLADLGCQSVSPAATIDQALDFLRTQIFDAAMLDMNMDGHSSEIVADALAAQGVPFVYATGNSSRDMRQGFIERPVLRKPFTEEQLTASLMRLVAR